MSHVVEIRDAMLERLKAIEFFAESIKTFRASRGLQVQPENLPFMGVYVVSENRTPDGDPNTGDIKYMVDARVGVSVIFPNENDEELENALDASFDALTIGLLTDATFTAFFQSTSSETPDDFWLEGIPRIERELAFGTLGNQNEMPIGQLNVHMSFRWREPYAPEVRDVLKTLHLYTIYPSLEDRYKVPQTGFEVTFTTE